MHRLQLQISEQLFTQLESIAEQKGFDINTVVKIAINDLLEKQLRNDKNG